MLKDFLFSFIPWILYFVILGFNPDYIGIAIILALLIVLMTNFKALRKGFILNWGTLLFFIFMLIAVVIFKNKWIMLHAWIFSNGTLLLIAWISILIRRPFTIQYAKEKVSSAYWSSPIFIRINYILTAVWGLAFLINFGLHIIILYWATINPWLFEAFSYCSTIFAIWFTAQFPDWYVKRKKAQ